MDITYSEIPGKGMMLVKLLQIPWESRLGHAGLRIGEVPNASD